jgi:hypothetical protein
VEQYARRLEKQCSKEMWSHILRSEEFPRRLKPEEKKATTDAIIKRKAESAA